jgi:hypothetical protein
MRLSTGALLAACGTSSTPILRAYVVGYVSRFLQVVKRILHYIVGTLEFGLRYGGVLEQQGCWATVTATLSTISVQITSQKHKDIKVLFSIF